LGRGCGARWGKAGLDAGLYLLELQMIGGPAEAADGGEA